MNRKQAVEFLMQHPEKFGHAVGFTKLTKLHRKWMRDMMSGKDGTLQASRNTYKTTCVSIVLALFCILLPNKRLLFMRKTDNDVKEVIKQVKNILLHPKTQVFVRAIYGCDLRLLTDSATELTTNLCADIKGTAQLVGLGIGSSLTGKHFDIIITDDIVNMLDRFSRAERERTKRVYQELQNVRNRGGWIYNTGTPWHPEDCFSIMPTAVTYSCYHEEVKELFTPEELEARRQSMTRSLFAANYELRMIAADDVLFTDPKTGADPALVEQSNYTHIDAAYGGEDYTVYTAVRKKDGKYYVLGRIWHKHVDDVLPEILALHNGLNCGKIYCEDNGDKGYLAKAIKSKGVRAVTYHEGMNKYLKIATILKAAWKDVVFVQGTDQAYIDQICDYNEDAEHDDAPDSLASLVRILSSKKGDSNDKYKSIMGVAY